MKNPMHLRPNRNFFLPALLAFLFLGLQVSAQQPAIGNDILYLKDGSIIKGTIMEYIVDSHVRIQTAEGKVHEFPYDQISKKRVRAAKHVEVKPRGYYNETSVGLLIGRSIWWQPAQATIQMVNGYQINRRVMTGFGVGVEWFYGNSYMPLFFEGRYNLRTKAFSPFVVANAGYNAPFLNDNNTNNWGGGAGHKGGLMGSVRVGIRNFPKKDFGYSLSFGYRFQQLRRDFMSSWHNGDVWVEHPVTELTRMNRVEMRIGILFN